MKKLLITITLVLFSSSAFAGSCLMLVGKIDESNIRISFYKTIYRTLGFTYLNPHVYSDTVFFLGNFSKSFEIEQKYLFGIGASISSFIFFFALGYLSKYLSNYLKNEKIWKIINLIIILFMSCLAFYVLTNILK